MSAGFQVSYNLQGDVVVADGVVIQPKTSVVIAVGGGVDLTGRSVLPGERGLTNAVSPGSSTAVGGSGRNLVCSGLASLSGLFTPTIPDTFKLGDFTLVKTGSSAATISDGTDVVAILSTGGTAPVGSYVGTTYGRATYNATAAFTLTVAAEEGAPGAIPDVLVTISAGTAQGGVYTATDAANYVSAVDADWTLFLDPSGSAELRYLGTAVATRATGEGHDPSGRFVAEAGAYFYNPLPAADDDFPGDDLTNPFGVLTLVYSWPATPDLDIGVTFLGETVGFGHSGSGTYMTWSGDDTSPAGSETVVIDLAQAWTDGAISSLAEVLCAADWYPGAGGSGLATLDIDYTVGAYSTTLSMAPGGVSPSASLVASLRILADGSVGNSVGTWQAHVRVLGRVPREGYAYLKVTEISGVLDTVEGPFFATALPSASGEIYYFPLAYCDGTKVVQFHTGALVWDHMIDHTHTFASLTSKPTTLVGYGITDAVPVTRTINGAALSGNITISSITGNAGTATALATARAIYGNNFDGTAAINQVIASTYGGTGNGFAKFTGPTTSEKTFTLPNANATLARTDAGQTFSGAQVFSGTAQFNDRVLVGPTSYNNVRLNISGSPASNGGSEYGIFMGALTLTPGAGNTATWQYCGGSANTSGGTLTSVFGYYAAPISKTGGGAIGTAYGIYVEQQTAGNNNYAGWFSGDVMVTGRLLMSGSTRCGTTTLVGGTKTVASTGVTANTKILLTRKTAGGTIGDLTYTISAGASFTINSASATDTSDVTYLLIEA